MKSVRANVLALLAGISLTSLATPVGTAPLEPFVATYKVVLRGVSAGSSELQLQREDNGRLIYRSRSKARGIFRMFFSEEITQTSLIEIDNGSVRPLHYQGDDGTESTERDIELNFDWSSGRLTGTAENKTVDLELPEGVQDPMSIQLALMHDLRAGRKPERYPLADKTRIKTYEYKDEGTARLQTALGELDTVVYSSHRTDSNKRIIRMWYAPSLGYIPVQAERLRNGKREWFMTIRELQRPQ